MKLVSTVIVGLSICSFAFGGPVERKAAAQKVFANVCSACHGDNAEGMEGYSPKLQGQVAAYVQKSIKDFKKGNRFPEHKEQVQDLDKKTIIGMGEFLEEKVTVTNAIPTTADNKNIAKFYHQKCASCHGQNGEGTDFGSRLQGQYASYMEEELQNFADGKRPLRMMQSGMYNLNGDKKLMHDVSVYLSAGAQ